MSFEEQIMSKDKYPSIFSPQMEDTVFIIFQIAFAVCTGLKIGNIWSCYVFRPIANEQKYLMAYKLYYTMQITVSHLTRWRLCDTTHVK